MSDAAPTPYSITPHLETLLAGRPLEPDHARQLMEAVVAGRVGQPGLAAVLAALRAKGEDEAEIAAFAAVLREHSVRIDAPAGTLDTCGTGGDGSDTFNLSTATALVAAGMGIPVAKHGNRSVSSKSGSADALKELGVNIEAPPATVARCVREAGIGFLFAPALHPGMKHAAPVRRELGVRTVFNLLGPLANPARAKHQLIGVFDPKWCEPFARVLKQLGSDGALVVCGPGPGGRGHLDEVSPWGLTAVARLHGGKVSAERFDPQSLGVKPPPAGALAAKDPAESARIIKDVLEGKPGAPRDAVLLNAAAAAQAAGKAPGWKEGFALAAQAIDSRAALGALAKLAKHSHEA